MTMVDYIGEAAMYEQFAEEATELAKAALKMARVIRKENPSPVTREKVKHMENLNGEDRLFAGMVPGHKKYVTCPQCHDNCDVSLSRYVKAAESEEEIG